METKKRQTDNAGNREMCTYRIRFVSNGAGKCLLELIPSNILLLKQSLADEFSREPLFSVSFEWQNTTHRIWDGLYGIVDLAIPMRTNELQHSSCCCRHPPTATPFVDKKKLTVRMYRTGN
jgi:hypothetical protein